MTNDSIRLFYDLTAGRTAEEWYGNELLRPVIRRFLSYLPGKPHVLDLGCGPGHESCRLRDEGAEVVGIDFSGECIRIARERCPQCRFEEFDFFELDDRFGRFDGIFAAASLIHVDPERMPGLWLRFFDVLNPGGYVLAIMQGGKGVLEEKSNVEVNGKNLRRTVYGYDREDLQKHARQSGFQFAAECTMDQTYIEKGWGAYLFRKWPLEPDRRVN